MLIEFAKLHKNQHKKTPIFKALVYFDGLISHIACDLTSNINTFNTSVLELFRGSISAFFPRWIKQHLKIKSIYGTSENAIHCQIWIAICTYLLVAIAKKRLKIGQSLYSFLQVISISIFEKEPVNQLVSNSDSHFEDSDFSNQLIIF